MAKKLQKCRECGKKGVIKSILRSGGQINICRYCGHINTKEG